jgi:hypothetical protein
LDEVYVNIDSLLSTIIIPFLLGGLGAGMAFFGWRSRRRVEASQSWFPAAGVVTAATLKRHVRKGGVDYEPHVEYTYTIMGTPYQGKRLCFGNLRLNQKKAWEKLGLYPKNGKVIVYYNSEKPTEAVLEREAPGVVGMMVSGALIALFGIGMLVWQYLPKLF